MSNTDNSIFQNQYSYQYLMITGDTFSKNPSPQGKYALEIFNKCMSNYKNPSYKEEQFCKEIAVYEILYLKGYSKK